MQADFFTTAVVTDPENGMFGISLLLIEREMQGVKLKRMNPQSLWATNTTFIVFDNVKVPVENLIGNENEGFKYIMMNFNHERLYIYTLYFKYCFLLFTTYQSYRVLCVKEVILLVIDSAWNTRIEEQLSVKG